MAELINLRTARKRKARMARSQAAEINRAKHGRTKAEKKITSMHMRREQQGLDGHQLEKSSKNRTQPTD